MIKVTANRLITDQGYHIERNKSEEVPEALAREWERRGWAELAKDAKVVRKKEE